MHDPNPPDYALELTKLFGLCFIWLLILWFLAEGFGMTMERMDRAAKKEGTPFALLTCQLIAIAVPIVAIYLDRIRAHCKRQARAAEQTRDMLAEIYGYKKPTELERHRSA